MVFNNRKMKKKKSWLSLLNVICLVRVPVLKILKIKNKKKRCGLVFHKGVSCFCASVSGIGSDQNKMVAENEWMKKWMSIFSHHYMIAYSTDH